MVNIIPATDEEFARMKGQSFVPHNGEGVVYIKVVALRPETIQSGPKEAVDAAQGVVLAGKMDEIQAQINTWFQQIKDEYAA